MSDPNILPEGYVFRWRTAASSTRLDAGRQVLQVIRPDGSALAGKYDTEYQAIQAARDDANDRKS